MKLASRLIGLLCRISLKIWLLHSNTRICTRIIKSLLSLLVRESRLCVFTSGSFAWHHFQLYDINLCFLFALGAIERETHKYRFPMDFDSGLAAANRAANPERIVRCLIHRNSSKLKWLCVNRLAQLLINFFQNSNLFSGVTCFPAR